MKKHGWDNPTLRRQDPIAAYLSPLRDWIGEADLLVGHNVAFDMRFLNAAFAAQSVEALEGPRYCTMLAYRARGEGSAALDAILPRLGLGRGIHGALQDAWLCMQVFLWLRDLPWRLDFAWVDDAGPTNYRGEPPKRPRGRPRKIAVSELSTKDAG